MPSEVLWRMKEGERRELTDGEWKHYGMVPSGEAAETVKRWNLYSPFFEYAVGKGKGPEKEKAGPFPFTFGKARRNLAQK